LKRSPCFEGHKSQHFMSCQKAGYQHFMSCQKAGYQHFMSCQKAGYHIALFHVPSCISTGHPNHGQLLFRLSICFFSIPPGQGEFKQISKELKHDITVRAMNEQVPSL